MPVPANTPALTLGRGWFDARKFRADTDPAIIDCLQRLAMRDGGAGAPGPAKSGDTTYQQLYARFVADEWFIYAGNPDDPVNPDLVTSPFSGSTSISVTDEGGASLGSFDTLNFVGANVTATNAGGGVADITVSGGSGSTNAFGTIQVSGQSDVVADAAPDTLTVVADTGIVISTNAGTDTLTFAINTATVAQHSFKTIAVSGQSDVVADSPTDTLTLAAAGFLAITTNAGSDTVTFTATGDGVGYDEIQEEGTPLTQRAKLNFIGEHVTAADNAVDSTTDVTFEYFIRIYGTTTTTVTAATTTFDVDGVSVIQGDMPELTGGQLEITNSAKIPIADENEAEFRWNEDAGVWETEPLKCHMIKGLATAAVTGGAFTIDGIELICGSDPRTDPSSATEAISIGNPFTWDIDNNGVVVAVKKANGDWIAIQAACPA